MFFSASINDYNNLATHPFVPFKVDSMPFLSHVATKGAAEKFFHLFSQLLNACGLPLPIQRLRLRTITTAVEPNGNNREPLAGCPEAMVMPPDCAEETNRSNIFSGGVASGDRADATARHLYKTNAAFIL